jgi:hypothetical protein
MSHDVTRQGCATFNPSGWRRVPSPKPELHDAGIDMRGSRFEEAAGTVQLPSRLLRQFEGARRDARQQQLSARNASSDGAYDHTGR